MDIYQTLLRPILFSGVKADPEWLHRQSFRLFQWLDRFPADPARVWLRDRLHQSCSLADPRLHRSLWGLTFPHPVGLAAGFDKDGVASGIWESFGFGFAELGTVTFHAQPGNPQPRLFRLPADHAVLNRMGFNNQGAAAMAKRLEQRWRGREMEREIHNSQCPQTPSPKPHPPNPVPHSHFPIPLGINLGKSKITPLEAAAEDYVKSFRLLQDWGNYFVVNVSSPNTPGLRSLQDKAQLEPILRALQQENRDRKPLLVKIAPDLEWEAIADVIALAQTHHLAGIIATNTTIRRDGLKTQILEGTGNPVTAEAGGISGAPVRARSTEVIRFIYKETQGSLPIIGVGGVFTAEDAWEKITAGASLVQTYTGWIYEGPWMVRRMLEGLLTKLDENGFKSIQEAVGVEGGRLRRYHKGR
ncbi:MAG: quinone-dependent dihydroorotate dehydrogenase [Leptolyngbyaceae cyanobacterium bins.302]|nr:quinone-dependent dihydroorotate dehydrogenase [Leptolyngbyaceae cyanobacterium bins.302]